jgi:hypothetical protein
MNDYEDTPMGYEYGDGFENDSQLPESLCDDGSIAIDGWPGDGSGTDDFADYNANEADDYRNEGEDDCLDTFTDDCE